MPDQKEPSLTKFINGSKYNIFTSLGRCMPRQSVNLADSEARKYKGLVNAKDYKPKKIKNSV